MGSELDPYELAGALASIPLFREVQSLLAGQRGPVNWEIAGQLARAISSAGTSPSAPDPGSRQAFDEAVRKAEMYLPVATGLDLTEPVSQIEMVSRPEWVSANLDLFRPLIERTAQRLQDRMHGEGPDDQPAVAGFLDVVGPFLLGIEVGFLLGYLARRVLGQFDFCFPLMSPGRVMIVDTNAALAAQELAVGEDQFLMWLALHESAHHLIFTAVPWARPHLTELAESYSAAGELDPAEMLNRLRELSDPDRLTWVLQHPEELLPVLVSPAQKAIAARIQCLMAVIEGFADWAVDRVGGELLIELPRLRESARRRLAGRASVERLLEALLGLDLSPEQHRAGGRFIEALHGAGELGRLWQSPANLPEPEELNEPARWLSRVAFS